MDNIKQKMKELRKQENIENQDKTKINDVTNNINLDNWKPVPYEDLELYAADIISEEEDYSNFDFYKKPATQGDKDANIAFENINTKMEGEKKMTYTTSWNEIVSQYKKNIDTKEEIVQNTWEMLFKFCFGYSDDEIDSQRSVKMGVMTKRADIVIKNTQEDLFVVELKRHLLHEGQEQLFSYLNQMKIDLGILVCDNLYIYDYDYTARENAFSVLEIPFEPDNVKGVNFVELFSKDNFDKQTIKDFIKESNEKIKAGNEIRKELTPALIKKLLRNYFSDKYPMPDIEKFLDEYNITINPKSAPIVTANSDSSSGALFPFSLDTLFSSGFRNGNYGAKDNTQYMVNGTPTGGKGPTVFATVDYYVKSNPGISFGELQQAFPDYLAKPGFGKMIRRVEDVGPSEWTGNRFKKQPIILEDGQRIVVTNQWKPDNMQSFIRGAKSLGIDIKPIE